MHNIYLSICEKRSFVIILVLLFGQRTYVHDHSRSVGCRYQRSSVWTDRAPGVDIASRIGPLTKAQSEYDR